MNECSSVLVTDQQMLQAMKLAQRELDIDDEMKNTTSTPSRLNDEPCTLTAALVEVWTY